jgi:hypothetical protein
MSELEDMKAQIINLSGQDLAKLRDLILPLDDRMWDEQIAADFHSGKFQGLIDRAREELTQGKAREI